MFKTVQMRGLCTWLLRPVCFVCTTHNSFFSFDFDRNYLPVFKHSENHSLNIQTTCHDIICPFNSKTGVLVLF